MEDCFESHLEWPDGVPIMLDNQVFDGLSGSVLKELSQF